MQYLSAESKKAMDADYGIRIQELRLESGATVHDLLTQFQAVF